MTKELRLILFLLIIGQRLYAQVPVADFTASVTSGCAPLFVVFKDNSSGSPLFWNWDFGDGNLSNQQSPGFTFTKPGVYSVTLVVRNGDGTNGITKTNYITVYPSPQAGFTANKTTGCVPSTIEFSDRSFSNTGTLTAWEWDFGDGTTSNAQNPSHQYTAPGFYTILLTVTSSTGCKNVASAGRYIRIVSGVVPDFDFTNPGTCRGPFNVPFTNLTSGPGDISYSWDFGNSTSSANEAPVATFANTGTYNVTLTALSEFGCSGSIQKPINITGTQTGITSPDTVCINTTVSFQNNSAPAPVTSTWDFGNGMRSIKQNDTSTYTVAGNYTIKLLNAYDKCTDSASRLLVVQDKPVVNFTAPVTTACKGPLTVNFTDVSAQAASWLWEFGDGATSTQQHPSHTYANEGQYDVTLTITTRQGCTNTVTKPAFVRIVKPTVSFSNAPAGGCVPFTFTPQASVNAIDGAASIVWDYGDGFTTTTLAPFGNPPAGPSHIYNTPGDYNIKITLTTIGGCTAESTLISGIKTGTPPVAAFSMNPTDACASAGIAFTDMSTPVPTPGNQGVDEWSWSFGDNTTSTDKNPVHIYGDSGTFTIRLTAFMNKCATMSAPQVVHIKPPIASFAINVDCNNGRAVNFTNQSKVDPAVTPVDYSWDFGDGSPIDHSATLSVLHTFPARTAYKVSLTVSQGGCSHNYTQTIQLVGDAADFSVSDNAVCKNEKVTFTTINSNPANIAAYEWFVNNTLTSGTASTFDTSFADPGNYNVILRITDVNGCKDDRLINGAVTVTGPIVKFTPVTKGGCQNNPVVFNDQSTATAGIKDWTFDFGDGIVQTFTAAPFSHVYTRPGIYIPTLKVTDANNCPDTYVSTDTIRITNPVIGFKSDYTTICPQTNVNFRDTSSGVGLNYHWDFGDGNTSTEASPVHQYNAASGSFTVKLIVTDTAGCIDSAVKKDLINLKKPKPAFTATDTSSICTLLQTKFTFQGTDYESFYWDFGDGSTSTLLNPSHFYNSYGSFEPKLYLIGYGGCIDSAMGRVNVYDPNVVANIAFNAPPTCNSITVDFTITTPPDLFFSFYFGDGAIDSSQKLQLQHYYGTVGGYSPAINIRDNIGCVVSKGALTSISVIGALPLFGTSQKAFCDEGTVSFTNYTIKTEPVVNTVWDFGDGATSSQSDPIHTFSLPGEFVVKHTVTTQSNCVNTVTDTVRIYATPEPSIGGDTAACVNQPLHLQGNLVYPDTSATWKWNLGANGTSATQDPTVKYPASGNYTVAVEVTNKLGCKGDTTKTLYVAPIPEITVAGNTTIPVGGSLPLPVTYSENIATYTWTPANALSCRDCPVPVANPKFNTIYNVAVTDIYGCTATKDIPVTVICSAQNYFVPNTFSPNGDGQNDVFMPRGNGVARVNRMQVFNRWGELVYEKRNFMANDASAGWNGTAKGKPANAGVYIYIIEFVCENASVIPYRGNVTLIR